MPHQPLRMIDANLNRSSEGLRVLEDIARFVLDDVELSQRLRTLRHHLVTETKCLSTGLLSYRDSEHDVGPLHSRIKDKESNMGTTLPSGLLGLVRANAKRVEESLRVIEELAKLPEISSMLNSAYFEQTRFDLYTLERDLVSRISRQDKKERLPGLYVIMDRQLLAGRDELDIGRQIIEGGARVIQLRDKQGTKKKMLPVAQRLKELCNQAGVLLMVNDYLDLALAVDADGLHIGQEDLPLSSVRRELPIDKIIGCSITTITQATKAQDEGADYVAVGSIFPTTTKKEATVVGMDILKELKRTVSIPIVAIGGINHNNAGEVVAAGADVIAVTSAILSEKSVKEAVRKLVAKIESTKEQCQSQ